MKLVIDIPEDTYNFIQQSYGGTAVVTENLYNAVFNGTLLPKGHGRLIDADRFLETNDCFGYIEDMEVEYFNKVTPTIIEADKAESEGSGQNDVNN